MCLEPFSKNAEQGELRSVFDGPSRVLQERECYSYKTIRQLNLDINPDEQDTEYCNMGDRLNGWLYVCDLVHAFSSIYPNMRGFHGGNFTWIDTTNAGFTAAWSKAGQLDAG